MSSAWPERVLIDRPAHARAVVIALHGFTRSGRHLQHLADRLVTEEIVVVRPTLHSLWWPRSMNRHEVIEELARAIGPVVAELPVAIVGHSAGAAAGACLAARLIEDDVDVRGLVFADGVESPTRHIERAWPLVRALPVRMIAAPASPCNRQGALTGWLAERIDGVFGVLVADSGHGDVEGEAHAVYRIACREHSSDEVRARVLDHVVWSVLHVLDLPSRSGRSAPAATAADVVLRGNVPLAPSS